ICLNIVFVFSELTGVKGSHGAVLADNRSNRAGCDPAQFFSIWWDEGGGNQKPGRQMGRGGRVNCKE
ncbi:MAG: hypothetical protein ACRDDI_11860, partial [Aeromonas veronii]